MRFSRTLRAVTAETIQMKLCTLNSLLDIVIYLKRNPNCYRECAIVGLCTTFYIVICDINRTAFDNGGVNIAWLGE